MALAAESQVILRNVEQLNGSTLLINPPQDAMLKELNQGGFELPSIFTSNFATYKYFENQTDCIFDWQLPDTNFYDTIILYYPKAKEEAKNLLINSSKHLAKDGQILVVGDNKGGIKSAAKLGKSIDIELQKLDSAKHCTLLQARPDATLTPTLNNEAVTYELDVAGQQLTIKSLPGVFNHGELDVGSKLLLENLPAKLKAKRILDFGCGCGVIGNYAAKRFNTQQVDMVDVSALALDSAKLTSAANGLEGRVFASDGLSMVKDQYHLILSNPPFHSGIKTHYKTTEDFLKQASRHLLPNGRLIIVANSFLKYLPILEKHYYAVNVLHKDNKFAVYEAVHLKHNR